MRTSPKPPTSPAGLASRSTSSRTKFPAPRMRGHRSMRNESHQSWCTGKDSNLRTSQGGTDLQSVGFNHSPTCANFRAFRPQTVTLETSHDFALCAEDDATAGNDPIEKQSARENPLARKHHTWKNSLWSAVGKNLLRRRAAQNALYSGIDLHIKPIKCWSWRRDLNPRPSDYKSDALPTELRQQSETKALAGAYIPLIPSRCPGQF